MCFSSIKNVILYLIDTLKLQLCHKAYIRSWSNKCDKHCILAM